MGNYKDDTERTPEYFLSEIRPEILSTFDEKQKTEILSILKRAVRIPTKKILSINFGFWFIKKLYITIYLGFDKRKVKRQELIRKRDYIFALTLKSAVYFFLFTFTALLLFLVVYFIKSQLGIDFFPDKHLRDFF